MRASQLATFERRLTAERAYWLRALEGEPSASTLPLDFARPAAYHGAKAAVVVHLPGDTAAAAARLCRHEPPLVLTLIAAAVDACLVRYTGADDVVIATPVPDSCPEIATFNQLVPVRLRGCGRARASVLRSAVRTTLADALRHGRYPFARLIELLALERPANRTPLGSVVVAVEGYNRTAALDVVMSDLVVAGRLDANGVRVTIEYDARLFASSTLDAFAEHLARTLSWLTCGTDLPLELVSPEERQDSIVDFNRTAAEYPDLPIHALFEAQAARTPDAAAVRAERAVTYRELDALANQMARALIARGIGRGARVGILVPHSAETLVAVLGVLKAGAAYVPLDPGHPAARVQLALDDSQAAVVLTTSALAPMLDGRDCLYLDADRALRGRDTTPPNVDVRPDDLAYVIYTSGSTGVPKGVAIAHRSLVNYVWWASGAYVGRTAADFALHSSLAFDLTVTTLFVPLVTGGAVVPYAARGEEPALLDVLREGRTAVLKLTPSHLAMLAEQPSLPAALRVLIVGGENLDGPLARRVHARSGGRLEIYNEYGPTEATVGCMIHRFDPAQDRCGAVPIGRPAANTRIYVLDEAMAPVPVNAVGHLYIGGDGLAAGYLGRPDLTAERFVPDPFVAGAWMYRAGDLARRLPSGVIEFIGRTDDQVKIRGHRIDLNEIRVALTRHPQVRDCAVRRLEETDGSGVLVAYYVSRHAVDEGELRRFLHGCLVDAAVPSAFVFLRRLPLTLNGKVNYRALPGLTAIRAERTRTSEPPRTPTETALAVVWRQVLGVETLGVHDNFFELGGHSLVATQVVSRIREALRVEVPLRTLFERPTIAGLASWIDADGVRPAAGDAIPVVSRNTPIPASFAQQRLWFLDQLDPGSAAYNIAARLHIDGPLDIDALACTFDGLVARHEALRTTFVERDGQPVQQIASALRLELPRVDLSPLPDAARAGRLAALSAAESGAPFDLREGPLIRARLVRLATDRHVLLFTLHHIIADGWSMGLLAREVSVVYAALRSGSAPALPPLRVQYADFTAWQRAQLTAEMLERELTYWRALLDDVPAIELPTDRPRPAVQTFRGASLAVAVDPGTTDAVRQVSRALDATPFMTLLAAYAAVLHRWSGQTDLSIGTPIANRTRPELEGIVGFFANTLVLCVRLDGRPSFREVVSRIREHALEAFAHQDVPFERLVEALQPERALSHNPLFQVMFGLHEAAEERLALPGLRFESLETETGTAKFNLNLLLDEHPDRLTGVLEYNTDLFDEATIVRFRSHLETLLAAALADPDTRVDELPVMASAERRQVLVDWNRTQMPSPADTVVDMVAGITARTPDALAVVFLDQSLTYAELSRRANTLAHYLRRFGVGPDVPVGLCLERSIDMAIAVLATLKAGGAYVPLDPAYPRERLAVMLDDTQAPVVIAHAATRERLPDPGAARIVWIDEERDAIAAQADTDPAIRIDPDTLLYVIYTSGSTGRPKGIALSHRALANLIRWNLGTLHTAAGTPRGVLQFASLSFDASFHEMFAAWASGRHLVMIPESWRRDASELLSYLRRWPVEIAILPVVVLHQWAEHLAAAGEDTSVSVLKNVRHIVTTGEQLVITTPIVDLFQRLRGPRLHNHYGPSETHVVTALMLDDDPAAWPARPSIGRPIWNSDICILDRRLNPVPTGVLGELFIGGANLARGYLNRPDLTAERFIPHPFATRPGERLYATGDIARWRTDGTIEFLGRRDDQVKIRGFRVELGDVESAINSHPCVSQIVVVARGGAGGQQLVAYAVPAGGRALSTDDLRRYVQERLPEYMVPSVIVVLDDVKLTPNGKIDRRALPPPPDERPGLSQAYVAPDGPAEELMTQIWTELLRLPRVGSRDNFFHLGGHSLLATQLASRVRRTFDLDLPLRAVFEAPTIAGLVEALAPAAGGRDALDDLAWAIREADGLSADEVAGTLRPR